MSIATSVVVRPSKCLSLTLIVMSILLLISAILLASFPLDDSVFVFHQLLIALCVAAAIYSVLVPARHEKIFFIDISASGVIRLRHTDQTAPPESSMQMSDFQDRGEIVQLQRDSTLWSMLLLLRFRSGNGLVHTVMVLPDSLDEASFRTLSTACHWVALQGVELQS
jgi:toxin CptA